MEDKEIEKIESMALKTARARVGSNRTATRISPTEAEWEAIQAGAVTNHMMGQIVANANSDTIKSLALPRASKDVTAGQLSRAKAMAVNGATNAQIAEALGISTSTLRDALYGG